MAWSARSSSCAYPTHAEADEGYLEFVAQVPQRIQDYPLLPELTGKDVVNLVEHEDVDINSTHEPKSHLLEIDDRSSRVLWRTQRRQDLRVEATLPGFARHLQSQNPAPLDPCRTVE